MNTIEFIMFSLNAVFGVLNAFKWNDSGLSRAACIACIFAGMAVAS